MGARPDTRSRRTTTASATPWSRISRPRTLEACHQRLASALLATGRGDPETLAMHYLGAGDRGERRRVRRGGGGQGLGGPGLRPRGRPLPLRPEPADQHCPPSGCELEVQLGDALANAGRGARGGRGLPLGGEGPVLALAIELHRRAAQQLYTSGHIEEGGRALRPVLAQARHEAARGRPRWRCSPSSSGGPRSACAACVSASATRPRSPGQDLLRIDTCWAVGVGLAIVDMVRGADFQARHLVLALRAGEPYRVARALAMEGAYVAMGGNRSRKRAQRLLQERRRPSPSA